MFAVTRLRVPDDVVPAFLRDAAELLSVLRERPGFVGGDLGRAADDPQLFALCTRWDGVGAYRRALSGYDVRMTSVPLLAESIDEPSAYEVLLSDGIRRPSDRADG